VKRIVLLTLLTAVTLGWGAPSSAQSPGVAEWARNSGEVSRKSAKQQNKLLKKASKKQRKAMKTYAKAQRKAARKAERGAR
jgi:hypothetical protein